MADYIDGTTLKLGFAEDQLFTIFDDRPESIIAHLTFGDPNQDKTDQPAVIADQRQLVEQVVAAANLAPQLQAILVAIADAVTHQELRVAVDSACRLVNKIRGA